MNAAPNPTSAEERYNDQSASRKKPAVNNLFNLHSNIDNLNISSNNNHSNNANSDVM